MVRGGGIKRERGRRMLEGREEAGMNGGFRGEWRGKWRHEGGERG